MVMRLLDLFSGIGGFSYAAEKLVGGYETVAFCEQDEFCQQVLRKHWKDVPIYDDVRTIDATGLGTIDIVAGGFPCQAVSQAGLQKATEDDRWLWDEMLRIIQDCKPRWVIGENVVGLININQGILFEQVQTDLEKEGYSVQSVVIPAASKNAPHRRDRVWIIAHSNINSQSNKSVNEKWLGDVSNTNNTRNRTSRTYIDKKQQTIEQGWKEQSFFEPSRHNELMADTKSSKSWEQTEWQGGEGFRGRSRNISRSKTEREEVIATDVSNTKRNTKRPTYRSNQRRNSRGWEVKNISEWNEMGSNIGNDSCIDGETENVSDTISQRGCSRETRREDAKDVRERSTSEKHRSRNFKCRMGYMADGISEALSGHFSEEPKDIPRVATNQKDRTKKLKALGNSIVPQVVAELFYAIRIAEYGE
jgi:DNA (cytosine-5)-methyltransferase 1